MDGTLSKIGIMDLAERVSHLSVNRMVYIYGGEDVGAGETYGLMVTDAFETRMYLLCYLGHTHCKAVSCDDGMEHMEEVSAIRDILENAWMEAGLTDFYVNEAQWAEKTTDITPVLATFIRTHRDGFDVSNYTDTFVVEVPTSVIDGDNGRLDATKEFIVQQMRKFAWNILIGCDGDDTIIQSCSDYCWDDFFSGCGGKDDSLGIYWPQTCPYPIQNTPAVDIDIDNPDECLLKDEVPATMTVYWDDGTTREFQVEVDMSSGAVYSDVLEKFEIWPHHKRLLDFGNGVKHPVAFDEESQGGLTGRYYFMDR